MINRFKTNQIDITAGIQKLDLYQKAIVVTFDDGESCTFPIDIFMKLFSPNSAESERLLTEWYNIIYPPQIPFREQTGFPEHGIEIENRRDGKTIMKPAKPELKPVK